jgi:hypothetical protein
MPKIIRINPRNRNRNAVLLSNPDFFGRSKSIAEFIEASCNISGYAKVINADAKYK